MSLCQADFEMNYKIIFLTYENVLTRVVFWSDASYIVRYVRIFEDFGYNVNEIFSDEIPEIDETEQKRSRVLIKVAWQLLDQY